MIRAITTNPHSQTMGVSFGYNEDKNNIKPATTTGVLAVVGYGLTKNAPKGLVALKKMLTSPKSVQFIGEQFSKLTAKIGTKIKPDSLLGKSWAKIADLLNNFKKLGSDFITSLEKNFKMEAKKLKEATGTAISVGVGAAVAAFTEPILDKMIATEK